MERTEKRKNKKENINYLSPGAQAHSPPLLLRSDTGAMPPSCSPTTRALLASHLLRCHRDVEDSLIKIFRVLWIGPLSISFLTHLASVGEKLTDDAVATSMNYRDH